MNDGRGEFYVDNQLVARIHCATDNLTNYVLMVDLPSVSSHKLEVRCIQKAPGDLTHDVFIYGAATLAPVPETSSLLALLCGLGGISGMMRKRR